MDIERLNSKKLFLNLFLPFLTFIIIDLTTTYCGVCILGGLELNEFGIFIASKFGFLFLSFMQIGIYAFGMLFLTYLFKSLARSELWKIFLIVFWCLNLLSYSQIIVYNTSGIIHAVTGIKPVQTEKIVPLTKEQLREMEERFEPIRPDFCRLI